MSEKIWERKKNQSGSEEQKKDTREEISFSSNTKYSKEKFSSSKIIPFQKSVKNIKSNKSKFHLATAIS